MGRVERWLPVFGWVGLYEVSDWGRVRSLDRMSRNGQLYRGRVLQPTPDRDGYLQVFLKRQGRRETKKVHRLVLEAFDPPARAQVRHGPGGKRDNRWPENICWGTQLENEADKLRDGTRVHGSAIPWAKLNEDIVRACRARRASGEAVSDLAREYGVERSVMRLAITGKTWKHVALADVDALPV